MSEQVQFNPNLNTHAVDALAEPHFALQQFVDVYHAGHRVIIAGGAVRDLLLNREVKDIDFVTDAPLTPHDLHTVFPDHGKYSYVITEQLAEYKNRQNDDGQSSLKYVIESEDKRINVLVVNDIDQKLASFPDTISMVYYEGEVKTPNDLFIKSIWTRTITVAERVRETRLARLQAKFPDFQFEVVNKDILQ